jgi:hypothetical protein
MVVQKVANKMLGWKKNLLTYPGRELLVKPVLTAMPTFFSQFSKWLSGPLLKLIDLEEPSYGRGRTLIMLE